MYHRRSFSFCWNNWNCWVVHLSNISCQYVVVYLFLFQCVDTSSCEYILIKKQLEQFSIKAFKRFLSICGGLILSLSVCGSCRLWTEFNIETNGTVQHFIIKRFLSICGGLICSLSVCGFFRLWTELNLETNVTVEHLIHLAFSVNMWFPVSFYFSVWMRLPWWNSSGYLKYQANAVSVVLIFSFQCVRATTSVVDPGFPQGPLNLPLHLWTELNLWKINVWVSVCWSILCLIF